MGTPHPVDSRLRGNDGDEVQNDGVGRANDGKGVFVVTVGFAKGLFKWMMWLFLRLGNGLRVLVECRKHVAVLMR